MSWTIPIYRHDMLLLPSSHILPVPGGVLSCSATIGVASYGAWGRPTPPPPLELAHTPSLQFLFTVYMSPVDSDRLIVNVTRFPVPARFTVE